MSLSTPEPIKQYRLAILASKNLDDAHLIPDLLTGNVTAISHLYTNGANDLVMRFCADYGIPFTVFPLTGGGSLPKSTSLILEQSDFVYIIADQESKSAQQVVKACEKKWGAQENDGRKHWRFIHFDPIDHWRSKVFKAKEILACMDKTELKDSLWAGSVGKALD